MLATLLFNAPRWAVPACAIVLVAAALLFWAYQRSRLSTGLRAACLALKLVGLIALALCLLDPTWITERARPGANFFVVLADNSLSLQIKDRNSVASRGEELKKLLTRDGLGWQAQMSKDFQVRRYLMDSRLQRTEGFEELDFSGKSSSLNAALRSLRDRFQGQPLAGVLLFSDGNFTDLPNGFAETNGLPPIYSVVIGKDMPSRDIALASVSATQTAFEDAPVTAQADVTAYGYAGRPVTAKLLDLEGKVVAEQTETAKDEESRLAFRFQYKPEHSGLSYYRVQVAAQDEFDQFTDDKKSKEATLANNTRVFSVDRGQEPYRVLYVSGRPNWEYKFLNRALQEDTQVQLVALIRVARREAKFQFKGRAGESSNPLFRGFGNQNKEEIERYDQPVFVRLNTRDQAELRGGFPKLPEELFSYHALILDDVEASFFTPDQLALIQKFVALRGGGFAMLGGAESFHQGRYQQTPIADLLPLYMDAAIAGAPSTNRLRFQLTREGLLQPWARLRSQETDERSRLEAMPDFMVLNRMRDFKPGATVVATVKDDSDKTYPAIAIQRFGNGRTAAVAVGDLWRWGLKNPELHKDLDKAWRQLVRWLVSDVPKRVDMQPEANPADPNGAVTLQVKARGKDFQPLDNASVSITDRHLGGVGAKEIQLTAEPSASESGTYEATYVPRDAGAYEAKATVLGGTGVEEGRIAAGWASNPGGDEFQSLKPNRALMDSIARLSGGETLAASGLDRFARELPNRKVPLMETTSEPLWHRSIVFAFALACFIVEWGVRRWKGLA
ncbi:MAG: hypothetical protein HYR88_01645 [Verrucomicrobia bacterium]|nr:hypothetical protein [Verrucomicrobiota bacterium]